jgi:hypothetical protein
MELATSDTKQMAFELWALKCNRRMPRVRQELALLGEEVSLSTLNRWARDGEWSIKVRETFEQLMPDVEARTWATMSLASEKAADYLDNVISGNFRPEVDPETADDEDPFNDPAFARIRVEAAKQVLLMTGWSPSGGFTKEKPHDPYQLKGEKPLSEYTYEELQELERQMVEGTVEQKQQKAEQVKKKRTR